MLDYSFSDSASEAYESNNSSTDSTGIILCATPSFSLDESFSSKENSNVTPSLLVPSPRPSFTVEEFQNSQCFRELESAVHCGNSLVYRQDSKYDLDSEEGQSVCRKFLSHIEVLCEVFKAHINSRCYRNEFSRAYRVLYTQGALSYLTEILDSAQEKIPHLWVNGEKYVFSNEVLETGTVLYTSFVALQQKLRAAHRLVLAEPIPVERVISEVTGALEEFDCAWVDFEHLYVLELMVIEADARRFVTKSIKIVKRLQESERFNEDRKVLLRLIGKINSVANLEGRGRDDLGLEILIAAEELAKSAESSAVKGLAESTVGAFSNLLQLFRSYEQNIETVDPQLKNNSELVEALGSFENTWEKAKSFFLNKKKCSELAFFANEIERLSTRYPEFREQIECRDSALFITIPGYLVLLCLEGKDNGLCKRFCPPLSEEGHRLNALYKELERDYAHRKGAGHPGVFYRALEGAVLGYLSPQEGSFDCLRVLKNLAMELQRHKPLAWNRFLDVVLC